MCGIGGILGLTGAPPPEDALERMTRALAHRGPDDTGLLADGPAALVHTRLSILDLTAAGHQPFTDASGRYAITYNGELYNFRALKSELEAGGVRFRSRTDTEVIVEAYARWGASCLDRFNGMFAFAILDRRERSLWLARDRLGIKPLYMYSDARWFCFASEVRALLATDLVPRVLDPRGVSELLHRGNAPAPATLVAGVTQLPPAHTLTVPGPAAPRAYWSLPAAGPARSDETALGDELLALLEDAVDLELVSDVPVGVFLSSGLDSSLLTALTHRRAPGGVRTLTLGAAHPPQDERAQARALARHLGTDHTEREVTGENLQVDLPDLVARMDVPRSDFPEMYYVCRHAAGATKVMLSGAGADELFGGYHDHRARVHRASETFARLPAAVRALLERTAPHTRWLPGPLANAPELVRLVSSTDWLEQHLRSASFSAAERALLVPGTDDDLEARVAALWRTSPSPDPVDRFMRVDLATYLPDNVLANTDTASMAFGTEVRVPFLDHRLVEWAAALPARFKVRPARSKWLLAEVARRLLPRWAVDRPKRGFGIPRHLYLRGQLAPLVRDTLAPRAIAARGVLNPQAVADVVDDFYRTSPRFQLWTFPGRIWTLFFLELWARRYLDAPPESWLPLGQRRNSSEIRS